MEIRIELTVTNILILFNIVFFVITRIVAMQFDAMGESYPFLSAIDVLGADAGYYILHGQLWRLVTSAFLHANEFHLFINMFSLYSLGNAIERIHGGKKVFALYILTGISGALLSALNYIFQLTIGLEDPYLITLSVGASGALFGFVGYLLVSPYSNVNKQSLMYILFLNLIFGFGFSGIIDNSAHIGGLIGGGLLAFLEEKLSYSINRVQFEHYIYIISVVLAGVSFMGMLAYNIF